MKITFKKSLATLLAIVMLFSCVGVTGFAEEEKNYEVKNVYSMYKGDTLTQRFFTWYTEDECGSDVMLIKVEDSDNGNHENLICYSDASKTTSHEVLVTGLERGTEYYYVVGNYELDEWSDIYTFTTDDGFQILRANVTMYGDTATQRAFTWYTATPCDTTVQIVDAGNYKLSGFQKAKTYTGSVSEWDGFYCHKAVITDLEPGVEYRYRVGSDEYSSWSKMGKFTTDNGDGKFSFITIADVQARDYEEYVQASNVMKAAMDYTPGAEFAVNLGDFVNDCTSDEWNWYGETFMDANLKTPIAPVAGNHDGNITNKLNVGWFDAQFNLLYGEGDLNGVNGVYYSYDYGNAHFTVLNSNDMYPMTEAQRNWIINDITNSDAQWKILILHRPPYSAGKNILKPDTMIMRQTIIEIVDETSVDLVLSGHDHMYYRSLPVEGDAVCNTTYVTEKYNGQDVTFALNPEGAIYAVPSTAGGKRYSVESTLGVVVNAADKCFSTRDMGGCFANVTVDGDKLVYKAYTVDDETQEVTQIDEIGIKKTEASKGTEGTDLPTDILGTLDGSAANFLTEFLGMFIRYIKLIPDLILQLF